MPPAKQIVVWLVVLFCLYAVVNSPQSAANIFISAWEVVAKAALNIAAFLDAVISRA